MWANVTGSSTGSTLVVKNVRPSDDGNQYRVVATNSAGTTPNNVMTLTVTAKPIPPTVNRIAGADRYTTNLAVVKASHKAGSPLFVGTGAVYPDALSAGPAVAIENGVLAKGSTAKQLPATTVKALKTAKVKSLHIVGSKSAVNGAGSNVTNVTLVGGTSVLSSQVKNLVACTK